MQLFPVTAADVAEVVALANLAYREDRSGWSSEAGLIAGTRLTEPQLRADLAAKPHAHLLLGRDNPGEPLLGTVWLEPKSAEVWYLGLLIIRPDLQDRKLGRELLAQAEDFAQTHGARRIRMTVLNVRAALLAWYQRRGYTRTGETEPFPYGDDRFGTPLRDDLSFLVLEKQL